MADIVVMKFGGTSVATDLGRSNLVERVAERRGEGLSPVVVVSAMGRAGDPYATDTLLSLIDGKASTPRERDLLMSCGEIISTVCVASDLRLAGIEACALSGMQAGIVTDDVAGNARIERIAPDRLHELVEDGIVPVVAGFQGVDDAGDITTLGRGGSDTTAFALGVALDAVCVEVYKDVDGIMTTDPRKCAEATTIERISADELFEMAHAGAKVVHAPAAEMALESGIPMLIRNTYSAAPGTHVVDIAAYEPSGVATAITSTRDIARIRVMLPYAKDDHDAHMEMQTEVFELIAGAGISIDMFTPTNDRLLFSVAMADLDRAVELIANAGLPFAVLEDICKVTLVGAGMHGVAGVMSRVARSLFDAHVDILQIADSHATISVIVDSDDEESAIAALHHEFGLEKSR